MSPADEPGSIAYFCGPMPGALTQPTDPEAERARVRQTAKDWLERHIGFLWPGFVRHGQPDWTQLVTEPGTDPFEWQYVSANVEPSARYVLTVPGSTAKRLWPDESGFANLVLAGDWTRNGFNLGCIEAAVMSGMLAANAVSGVPASATIAGLDHE